MSLIVFMIVFVIISVVILRVAEHLLGEDEFESSENGDSCYITLYIKGTARGSMGLFESNSMLEDRRAELAKRNSKF